MIRAGLRCLHSGRFSRSSVKSWWELDTEIHLRTKLQDFMFSATWVFFFCLFVCVRVSSVVCLQSSASFHFSVCNNWVLVPTKLLLWNIKLLYFYFQLHKINHISYLNLFFLFEGSLWSFYLEAHDLAVSVFRICCCCFLLGVGLCVVHHRWCK